MTGDRWECKNHKCRSHEKYKDGIPSNERRTINASSPISGGALPTYRCPDCDGHIRPYNWGKIKIGDKGTK